MNAQCEGGASSAVTSFNIAAIYQNFAAVLDASRLRRGGLVNAVVGVEDNDDRKVERDDGRDD